jgi:hypothetical protein
MKTLIVKIPVFPTRKELEHYWAQMAVRETLEVHIAVLELAGLSVKLAVEQPRPQDN